MVVVLAAVVGMAVVVSGVEYLWSGKLVWEVWKNCKRGDVPVYILGLNEVLPTQTKSMLRKRGLYHGC